MPSLASTTNVTVGTLQTAINNAVFGDTLVLAAGSTHAGTITLPNKTSGSGWVTIISAGAIPVAGTRVAPGNLSTMATITGGNGAVPAVATDATAHHYRFIGIEFKPGTGAINTGLVRFGSGSETDPADLPHHLIVDRCYAHGDATNGCRRGISGQGNYIAVIDSYISDCFDTQDAQAFASWNGQGPFLLTNNYLEGSGENTMFGGADAQITNLVPSDITITRNLYAKPVGWRGVGGKTVKNIFEIKNARRVFVDHNTFAYNWQDGQNGMAINLKSANQSNSNPWAICEHVTFTNNVIQHVGGGLVISNQSYEYPAQPPAHILIQHNNFEDVSAANWGGSGFWLVLSGPADDIVIDQNWANNDGNIISSLGNAAFATTRLRFTNNAVNHNDYGVKGDAVGIGNPTLAIDFPSAIFTGNQLVGGSSHSADYPSGNTFPVSLPTEPVIP